MVVETMLNNVPIAGLAAISAGLLRNISGWIENSYKDGKINDYEVKQLVGTVVKYFSGVMLLMLGLPIGESIAGIFTLDVVSSSIKKYK